MTGHHPPLVRNDRGTAAIEFALILPVMLTLLFGSFEVTRVINANTRLAAAAQTMADLIAQQSSVSSTTITNFCNGEKLVMTPFSGSLLTTTVASVTNKGGTLSVDWQDTSCGSASTITNATTMANSLVPDNGDSVIIVKAGYSYTSPVSYVLHASYALSQVAYARPQRTASIPHS